MFSFKCHQIASPRSGLGALARVFGWALGLALPVLVWAQSSAILNKDPVGDVMLVIGTVQVQRGEQQLSLSRGSPLMVGDSIQTHANGHVHLRFVDGALVSVRPASSLKIVEYRFDKANPSASVVRFQLDQGVVRAISGQAAEAAKDKFRLNTPLAAIGVKGTDFVVESGGGRVNAIVNQGAIILAPIDGLCRADGLGPCASMAARELSAAMRGMAITYSASMVNPQLLPMGQLKGSELPVLPLAPLTDAAGGNSGKAQQAQVDGKSAGSVDQILRKTTAESALVWGRWGNAKDQDALTISFRDAMQSRAVTVGDGYYFLFRNESGAVNMLPYDQGIVNFGLQSSHATYVDAGNETRAATVAGGTLGVNFSSRDFATTLQLKSPMAADQTLQSSGKVSSDGIFLSNAGTGKVAGALSLDTRQAGYFFSQPSGGGTYRGATTWGR
jgi:hypothetical protein